MTQGYKTHLGENNVGFSVLELTESVPKGCSEDLKEPGLRTGLKKVSPVE